MSIREAEKRATILVVEDEIDVVWVLKMLLERAGHSIVVAHSGKEALEILGLEPAAQPAGSTQPDLILLDVMMEGLNGFQVCERIKQDERLSYIPIIMLTVRDLPKDKVRGLDCGADDYVAKPFNNAELLARIRTHLRIKLLRDECNRTVDALRESKETSRALLDAVTDVAGLVDTGGFLLDANEAMAQRLNMHVDELTGVCGWGLIPPDLAIRRKVHFDQVVESGEPVRFEDESQGIWFDNIFYPVLDAEGKVTKVAALARDITERVRAEQALKKAHEELERRVEERTAELAETNALLQQEVAVRKLMAESLQRRNRELATLNCVGRALNSTLNLDQVLATVLEEVRRLLGVAASSIWLTDPETDELVCQQAIGSHQEIVCGWQLPPGEGLAGWVVNNGKSLIVPDTQADERHFKGVDQQTGLELRSIVSIPLRVKQDVIGVLQVVDDSVGRFDTADLSLLEPLAASAAVAVENARLYGEAHKLRAFNENIVQSMEEGILLEDETGHITFVNPKIAELLSYTFEELRGRPWTAIVPPECVAQVEEQAAQRSRGVTSQYETTLLTRGGQRVPVIVSARPLFDDGRFTGVLSVFTDITERKRTEETLRWSEKRYRHLFDNAPLCIFEMDLGQTPPTIIRANHQAEKVYGWSSEEIAAASLEQIAPSETIPDLEKIAEALAAGQAITRESINRRRDGSVFPVRISATPEATSILDQAVIIVEDITADKARRSEEAAIAEERGRIAREIHDGLAQDLASLRLRTRLWHDLVDHDPAQMHTELDALRELLGKNINEVRRSIFALRPVSLDELGFYPALRQFASDFGDQNQLQVDLRISGPEDRLPSRLEPVLFRIIQEALNNIGKHARASAVWIELDLTAVHSMTLMVRDNGVGFELAALDTALRRGQLGLKQMRERAEELEGTFEVQSEVGKGTRIQVVLPLSQS